MVARWTLRHYTTFFRHCTVAPSSDTTPSFSDTTPFSSDTTPSSAYALPPTGTYAPPTPTLHSLRAIARVRSLSHAAPAPAGQGPAGKLCLSGRFQRALWVPLQYPMNTSPPPPPPPPSPPLKALKFLGLRSGFEPPDLDWPGRLPHQQGLCEARLGYRDGSPQLGVPGTQEQPSLSSGLGLRLE